MTLKFPFFADAANVELAQTLEGFRYRNSLIDTSEERGLIERIREFPFREFDFHGYKGKRRVVSFGWRYDFSGQRLQKADDIPEFLLPLRATAAAFAGLEPAAMQHVLVTEYSPGAGIGWHRDKAVFGQVVGVSLLTSCILRFRREENDGRMTKASGSSASKSKRNWQRVNVLAEPRSAYHLTGPARLEWQHSILRVESLRYSITFRNMRED
ncbi:MAG TPA: alpha-ketoglutarate-dependent dioxygenase AlkB [Pyrinomonadaceae bacterium]|nr:alpha-ketoglutarate-dependent dioxygenase AlkB [Pyrinomonadaceae bacterium]